ncbi:sensor histidine kinase [Anaerosacchariphilus polymeriproducens]|uniref:histidine kinase n=1 Tax=Anaerosacchariphilus polymeriproducens TaxID=1812858 RepID=A0A371AXX4_9FIRM|nr:HAMP domain-containing sensor histidine kinase [Anaerosacchariphilus polymeriproducens]RDU24428.1 sensor histidine kinase [Anaerosacchariphilus polymeriproducens]
MRHSIKKQIATVFILLFAGTIFSCLLVNAVFLVNYYQNNKKNTLKEAFAQIKATDLNGYGIPFEFLRTCSKGNIGFVICDSSGRITKHSYSDSDYLIYRLRYYQFEFDVSDSQVVVGKDKDARLGTDFLELYGVLDSGDYILLRTPIESIKESASLSNRFLVYISLCAIGISAFIIWFVTKKLTDPILEIVSISARMANLDFDAKYTNKTKNEIGLLGANINQLSSSLEHTISELKTANNELLEDIEKKKQIDEMRKEFLSNVSHELKTPIAIIQGYSEGLKECVNDDAESRDFYCNVIMDEADKMNKMVKQLLTLNQIEFGNDTITMERFDIVGLTKGLIQASQILAEQKNAKIIFHEPSPIYVWADEFKVEEVLTNFLSNAIHYVDNENIIEVKIMKEKDTVRISVFNTGTPIPEEDLDKIWIKFYKVDKARTREYGGSGIGLSIVRAIMDSFHRECGVINYDNGVEFWFELDSKA